jgi:trehalose-6-phosphatase
MRNFWGKTTNSRDINLSPLNDLVEWKTRAARAERSTKNLLPTRKTETQLQLFLGDDTLDD